MNRAALLTSPSSRPKCAGDLVEHGPDLGDALKVRLEDRSTPALLRSGAGLLLGPVVVDRNPGALRRKAERDRPPDPLRRSGHQDDFAGHAHHRFRQTLGARLAHIQKIAVVELITPAQAPIVRGL